MPLRADFCKLKQQVKVFAWTQLQRVDPFFFPIMEKNRSTICAEITQAVEPVLSSAPQVLSAVLFGSLATGSCSGKSDIDLAVYVRDPDKFSFRDRLALQGDCCRALHRNDVDLVVMNQLDNLILLEHIIREGIVIYSIANDQLDIFMVQKIHQVIDFRHQRERAMNP